MQWRLSYLDIAGCIAAKVASDPAAVGGSAASFAAALEAATSAPPATSAPAAAVETSSNRGGLPSQLPVLVRGPNSGYVLSAGTVLSTSASAGLGVALPRLQQKMHHGMPMRRRRSETRLMKM
jgi:hypothetical protein